MNLFSFQGMIMGNINRSKVQLIEEDEVNRLKAEANIIRLT